MDPKYYCDVMQSELTGLKGRIYNIIAAVDKMPQEKKGSLAPEISDLHGLVSELSGKIDDLKKECPVDWDPHRKEIEEKKSALIAKINWWDEEHIAGGYVGG
ncbi:hypothetical protein ACFL2P_02895 [Candidatus Moduliflexota bacterium]